MIEFVLIKKKYAKLKILVVFCPKSSVIFGKKRRKKNICIWRFTSIFIDGILR